MEPARKRTPQPTSPYPIPANDNWRSPNAGEQEFNPANDNERTISGGFNRDQYGPRGISDTAETAEKIKAEEEALLEQFRAEEAQVRQRSVRAQRVLQQSAATPLDVALTATRRSSAFWGMSAHSYLFLTVQLPLAIASLAFLAIGASLEASWFGRRLLDFGRFLGSVGEFAFGSGFSILNLQNLFLALHVFLYAIMLLALFATILCYFISGQKPLSGKGIGLKYTTFLLALIGYAIPLANLVPWTVFYIAVMWRYPR